MVEHHLDTVGVAGSNPASRTIFPASTYFELELGSKILLLTRIIAGISMNSRNGRFVRVKDNLYRYTATKKYYAVYRRQGKLRFKSLKTADREIAERALRTEIQKSEESN